VFIVKGGGSLGVNADVAFAVEEKDDGRSSAPSFNGLSSAPSFKNSSKAAEVLSHVASAVFKYIKAHPEVEYVTFSSNDSARQKVYAAMGKRLVSMNVVKTYGFVKWKSSYYLFLSRASRQKFDDNITTYHWLKKETSIIA
jgi:hypothetical protein